jgi:hypothetical protein
MDDLRHPEWSVPGSGGMSDLKALNEAFDAHFTSDKKNRDAAIAAWNAVHDGALVDRAEYERANAVSAEISAGTCSRGRASSTYSPQTKGGSMSDISDKAVQKALEILEIAALTHDDFTASDTCAAAFATVKARIDADAKVIDAAIAVRRGCDWWSNFDAALADALRKE